MDKNLDSQYDSFPDDFIKGTKIHNDLSRAAYYSILENIIFAGKTILDVGCGDGWDLKQLMKKEAICYGIDSSKALVNVAQKNIPSAKIIEGNMESLPYENSSFDVILSKYAIQTSTNVPLVLSEMDRVLKTGGTMVYLAVHPLRQFLEKKKHPKDYFEQEVVKSVFFGGSISANEPTHTLNEYLNPNFLRKYQINHFQEYKDFPSSEKVDGDEYPCFFVLKATKL